MLLCETDRFFSLIIYTEMSFLKALTSIIRPQSSRTKRLYMASEQLRERNGLIVDEGLRVTIPLVCESLRFDYMAYVRLKRLPTAFR